MAELTITKDNFKKEVLESGVPVLLDFWASWCGPCRMLAPAVAAVASKYEGRAKVGKVNVDEQPELASSFRVVSIPTVVVMKGGKIAAQSVGLRPQAELERMLDASL